MDHKTLAETEESLRLSVLVEIADGRRRQSHGLGFAQIDYGRLFHRDYWTLFAIARELDCGVADLAPAPDRAERRAKWDLLTRASEEILATVRSLPAPLREIAEARGLGHSWRKIHAARRTRLMFSLKDDFAQALLLIHARSTESVRFLASSDNFIVVRRQQRA